MKIRLNDNTGFWNFYRDGVSQSLIGKFRECPLQCKLAYYDGWTSKRYSQSIHFGNAVHYVLAETYGELSYPLAGETCRKLREYGELWAKEQNELGEYSLSEEAQWQQTYALAEAILLEYFAVDEYKVDFKNNWLYTEKEFKIPYTFSMPHTGEIVETFLRGKIDGGFEVNDRVELIDHKCKSIINMDAIVGTLPYDLQCNMYLLAYYKMTGVFPAAIKYNIIRIPQSKPKSGQDLDEFIIRLREKIAAEKAHYFSRVRLEIIPSEILNWEKNWLIPNLIQIKRWFDSGCSNLTMNPNALEGKYGMCEFFHLITCGSLMHVYKRKHVFPELESPINADYVTAN